MSTTPNTTTSPSSPSGEYTRPPNAFIEFCVKTWKCGTTEDDVFDPHTGTSRKKTQAEISKEIGVMWDNVSPEVRERYNEMDRVRALKHRQAHPVVKSKPRSEKQKARVKKGPKSVGTTKKSTRSGTTTFPSTSNPYPQIPPAEPSALGIPSNPYPQLPSPESFPNTSSMAQEECTYYDPTFNLGAFEYPYNTLECPASSGPNVMAEMGQRQQASTFYPAPFDPSVMTETGHQYSAFHSPYPHLDSSQSLEMSYYNPEGYQFPANYGIDPTLLTLSPGRRY
ncbi:hypothetical protein L218DRAFT_1027975 [Marasmius fiardii PR-910]|nr:hypothetical protein L218DRAFT_1027975 [Marasmius fiardii PR-910]